MEAVTGVGCAHLQLEPSEHPDYSRCVACHTRIRKVWDEPADLYTPDYWTREREHPTIQEQVYNVATHKENGRSKNEFTLAYLSATGSISSFMEIGCVPGALMQDVSEKFKPSRLFGLEAEECFFWEMELPPNTCRISGLFPFCTSGLPDGSISHIVALDVFEHSPHPAQFAMECHRLLKPRGHLMMMLPMVSHGQNPAPRSYHPEHIYIHSHMGLRQLLEDVGFTSVVFDQWCPVHDWVWAIKGGSSDG